MMMIWAMINSKAGRLFLAVLLFLSVLGGVYLLGAHNARQAAEIERLERDRETRDTLERLENETRNLDDGDLADRISR